MNVHRGAEAAILDSRVTTLCVQHDLTGKREIEKHEGAAKLARCCDQMFLECAELMLLSPTVAVGASAHLAILTFLWFAVNWESRHCASSGASSRKRSLLKTRYSKAGNTDFQFARTYIRDDRGTV